MKFKGIITRKDEPLTFETTFQAVLHGCSDGKMYTEINIPNDIAESINVHDKVTITLEWK